MADEQPWWMNLLTVVGGFSLFVGVIYLLQAVLSAFNGSSSDGTVANHFRFAVMCLAFGAVLWIPMTLDLRRKRQRQEGHRH